MLLYHRTDNVRPVPDGLGKGAQPVRIGAHLSISAGLPAAGRQALALGANTFGFHTRNPRGGAARTIGADELAEWRRFQAEHAMGPLVGHLPYVVNLGSERSIWDFGVRVVAEDLLRCHAFGAAAIVLHPGHVPEAERPQGLERVAAGVRAALAQAGPDRCHLLLEGMAGQTGEVGATPGELGAVLDLVGRPDGLGVCLDTCHLFAAGWDLRTTEGIDAMLAAFDASVGRAWIGALHLNDSKFPLGSHRDRHARLGQGELGEAGLGAILAHPFLSGLPLIIETPVEKTEMYAEEIATARRLASKGAAPCAG